MRKMLLATVATVGLAVTSAASADVIMTPYTGGPPPPSDCAGVFGASFETCVAPNGSPVIIKYEFDEDGNITGSEINDALFPTVDGTEFTINVAAGTWSYILGDGDPGVTAWAAKGGREGFNLFTSTEPHTSGSFSVPGGAGLSHITFYDTAAPPPPPPVDPVPEPASLALLGLGLAGLGIAMRRRRRED
jgi:hypothetical protein